jgi:Psb28 protein
VAAAQPGERVKQSHMISPANLAMNSRNTLLVLRDWQLCSKPYKRKALLAATCETCEAPAPGKGRRVPGSQETLRLLAMSAAKEHGYSCLSLLFHRSCTKAALAAHNCECLTMVPPTPMPPAEPRYCRASQVVVLQHNALENLSGDRNTRARGTSAELCRLFADVRTFTSSKVRCPSRRHLQTRLAPVCKSASIQFVKGLEEPCIPEVQLTRSKDGSNGTGAFRLTAGAQCGAVVHWPAVAAPANDVLL